MTQYYDDVLLIKYFWWSTKRIFFIIYNICTCKLKIDHKILKDNNLSSIVRVNLTNEDKNGKTLECLLTFM